MMAPARGPAKLMTAGFNLITNALTKILGAQFLKDLQTFVSALDTVFGGFRQRAQQTYSLLQADGTAFLVVAAPEPDALREAAYFVERLSEDGMPLAGLIVNRASPEAESALPAEDALAGAGRLRRDGNGSIDGRAAAAARRPGPAGRARARCCATGSRRRTRRCRPPSCRRSPATSTTSTGSAGSASCSPKRVGARRRRRVLGLAVPRRLEDLAPRRVRPAAEQRPPLPLGHAAPDAPLDLVVERLGEALGAHRATGAHHAWPCSAQRLARRAGPAARSCRPLAAPSHQPTCCCPHHVKEGGAPTAREFLPLGKGKGANWSSASPVRVQPS